MPKRKPTGHRCRINSRVIEELRQNVRRGLPWRQPETPEESRGYVDLIYVVKGLYYPLCTYFFDKDDDETFFAIWEPLRRDILEQQAKRDPDRPVYGLSREQ